MKKKLEDIKKNGFKAPKSYFDTLETTIFDKIISENFPNEDGFTAPENHLDTVEEKVLANLAHENKTIKIINFNTILFKRILPIAVAASLLLFIFIKNNTNSNTIEKNYLTSTEIEYLIENDLLTFNTYEITEAFSDVELENQHIFDDQEMLDYLNGTDIEDLILETDEN